MTAPSQHVSRWGSLFQQAVAGVESRLDNILADGVEDISSSQVTGRSPKLSSSEVSPHQQISTLKQASITSRANESLQERLTRAVSSKKGSAKGDISTSNYQSGLNSASAIQTTPEFSSDVSGNAAITKSSNSQTSNKDKNINKKDEIEDTSIILDSTKSEVEVTQEIIDTEQNSLFNKGSEILSELIQHSPLRQVHENAASLSHESLAEENSLNSSTTLTENEALLKKLQSDIAAIELQRQEDSRSYTEKIDALQSKLQYMAREASERAKLVSSTATSSSHDKKLAEKEQQIAMLFEEGLSLSKKELGHLTTIKKLRIQLQEVNKEVTTTKKMHEAAKKEAIYAEERLNKMRIYEKQVNDQQNLIAELRNNLRLSQIESKNNDLTIKDMKSRLDDYIMRDTQAEIDLLKNCLLAEQKRVAELQVDNANLKAENKLAATNSEITINDLKLLVHENEQRALEREKEMKTELQILESKLEATRKSAEEVSSGVTGDTHARLLRQIETLQTQYSIASENWHGIEASLMAKVYNLEREKDEAIRKDIDNRRKSREVVQKMKNTEGELIDLRAKISTYQQEISRYKLDCEDLKKQAQEAETTLESEKNSFDQERQSLKLELHNRLAEEKQKWLEEMWNNNSPLCSRRGSSIVSLRKSLTYENVGLQSNQSRSYADHSISNELTPTSHLISNFSSAQIARKPSENSILSRKSSRASLKEKVNFISPNPDPEDFLENSIASCPSLQNNQELDSNSTVGAGLSVQLVERMSSAVRRLECEKVAMQEDITRLSSQRDEARTEIINLMPEVEAKKNAEMRIVELEKELEELKMRYETTLVMLGEKSEEIDELKGDIQDIKTMYRDLVEKTVK